MDEKKLFEALNDLDDELIEQSEKDVKYNKKKVWVKWGAAVAALCFIITVSVIVMKLKGSDNNENGAKDLSSDSETTDINGDDVVDWYGRSDLYNIDGIEPDNRSPIPGNDNYNNQDNPIDYEWVPVYTEHNIPETLKTYTLSYAKLPDSVIEPVLNDFDIDGSGDWDNNEWKAYDEAKKAWSELISAQRAVENYDAEAGKNAILAFTNKTLKQILKEKNHENRLYSPINIYIALGMLAETTDGNTRQQILDLLGVGQIEDVRTIMKGLWNNTYIDSRMKALLASSIWLRDDQTYNLDTLKSLAENYYASSFFGEMGSEDYSEALRTWLNDQTDGLLEGQIEGLELNKNTVMALATTVLFSARWNNEFNKYITDTGDFHSASGDITCDFMHASTSDSYFYGEKFGAIIKWFEPQKGNMMFILPDEGVDVYDLLDDEQLLDFISNGFYYENSKRVIINMTIPKFDVASKDDLKDCLQELGITDAFDVTKADFSPLFNENEDKSDGNIWLDKVEHGVRVIADEEGVKAAAYALEDEVGAMIPPEEEVDFVLDRPFIFVIRLWDGTPMFIGIVENP